MTTLNYPVDLETANIDELMTWAKIGIQQKKRSKEVAKARYYKNRVELGFKRKVRTQEKAIKRAEARIKELKKQQEAYKVDRETNSNLDSEVKKFDESVAQMENDDEILKLLV